MESDLMELQQFHGNVANFLYGMPLAQIRMHHLTPQLQHSKLEQLANKRRIRRHKSTNTLYHVYTTMARYINKNGGLVYNVEIPCNRENEASQAKKKESNYGFSYLSQGTQYYEEYIFEEDQATDCCINCTESIIYTAFGCFAGLITGGIT
ncbi:hypothetical protein EMCRGX_G029694 [Ephydatia muelleri]